MGNEEGGLGKFAQTIAVAAGHKMNRFRDCGLFPKMFDTAVKAKDRLDTEIERKENEFAGLVLDACLDIGQQPCAQLFKDRPPKPYGTDKLLEYDVSTKHIPLKFEGEGGRIRQSYPTIESLDEGYRFKVDVDYRTGKEGTKAALKDPLELIRDFRNGKTEGIYKITVRLEASQVVSPVPVEQKRGHDDRLQWADEYQIEIMPTPPRREGVADNLFRVEVFSRDEHKSLFSIRQFAPYGYQDKYRDILMQIQGQEDGSIRAVEEPQIPEPRIKSPIKEVMDEAKREGMMDIEEFEKRYGYGSDDDKAWHALADLQISGIPKARERIGLVQRADMFLQQFLERVKNGPKNLSQTVYIPFTPPDRDPVEPK
ncbi:hypothetical protein MUP32_05180 [Candidatus Microgenomates bacterium]|nr:hypothetical protein [Candidatus Microgenomates bacterium]